MDKQPIVLSNSEIAAILAFNRKIAVDSDIEMKVPTRIISPLMESHCGFIVCDFTGKQKELWFAPVSAHSAWSSLHPNMTKLPLFKEMMAVFSEISDCDRQVYFVYKTSKAHACKGISGFRNAVKSGIISALVDTMSGHVKTLFCDQSTAKASFFISASMWKKKTVPYLMEQHNIPADMLLSGLDIKGKYLVVHKGKKYYVEEAENEDDEAVDYTDKLPAKGLQIWSEFKFGTALKMESDYVNATSWHKIYIVQAFIWYAAQVASGIRKHATPYEKTSFNAAAKVTMAKRRKSGKSIAKPINTALL